LSTFALLVAALFGVLLDAGDVVAITIVITIAITIVITIAITIVVTIVVTIVITIAIVVVVAICGAIVVVDVVVVSICGAIVVVVAVCGAVGVGIVGVAVGGAVCVGIVDVVVVVRVESEESPFVVLQQLIVHDRHRACAEDAKAVNTVFEGPARKSGVLNTMARTLGFGVDTLDNIII